MDLMDSCGVQVYCYNIVCGVLRGDILLHQTVVAGSTQAYLFACRVCDGKSSDSTHRSNRIRDNIELDGHTVTNQEEHTEQLYNSTLHG